MMRCGLLLAAACAASGLALSPATDEVIKGEYIVLLHPNVSAADHASLNSRVGGRKFSIGKGFRAVHASLKDEDLKWVLSQDHLVKLVEHNQVVRALGEAAAEECKETQDTEVSWGQVRTTSSGPTAVDMFRHNADWGSNSDVYVIDTGVLCSHVDFEDRCVWGTNTAGGSDTDVNGHGTHCASTSAGKSWGIAKKATIYAVKVLGDNGSGSTAGVIAGVEWVVNAAGTRPSRRAVGNMSLGGGLSTALNNAVDAAVSAGVLMAVAAGNDNADARNYSPASAPHPITVGSTEMASSGGSLVDARSWFSNFGPSVDVFAPGSSIVAAYVGSNTATATLSGTSMACPHVAGVLASGLSMESVVGGATPGVITGLPSGTPDLMLHLQCSS